MNVFVSDRERTMCQRRIALNTHIVMSDEALNFLLWFYIHSHVCGPSSSLWQTSAGAVLLIQNVCAFQFKNNTQRNVNYHIRVIRRTNCTHTKTCAKCVARILYCYWLLLLLLLLIYIFFASKCELFLARVFVFWDGLFLSYRLVHSVILLFWCHKSAE